MAQKRCMLKLPIGAAGRAGDAGVYGESSSKKGVTSNSLNLPSPTYLRGNSAFKVNYHIVGNDAFLLSKNLMKPYPHRHLEREKRIFNYRLSRARRVVGNAFGVLAHRWRVFLITIKMCPDKLTYVIFAACCLHNYLVEKKNNSTYTAAADIEDADHTISEGVRRNEQRLTGLQSSSSHNPPRNTKAQREILTTYFNSHGSVLWQGNMVLP